MDADYAVLALGALAQETRLAAFRLLVNEGPEGIAAGALAEAIGVPANTMSTHLSILTRAGLVSSRRDGRSIIYSIDQDGIRDLLTFLVADCCGGRPEMCKPIFEVLETACCPPSKPRSPRRRH